MVEQRSGRDRLPGLAALLLLALACRRDSEDPAGLRLPAGTPVVVISIDTLRSDHLPAYGYSGVETPAIDRLRKEGILFSRAYAHAPLTLPSHASLLTGLLSAQHGVRDNVGYRLDAARLPSLPRLLKDAGYATGGVVSSYVLRAATGLSGGFDLYDDEIAFHSGVAAGGLWRTGADSLAAASQWLRTVAGRPFFLLFHLYEPHMPYEPPEPFRAKYPSAYDGEIAAADAVVSKLIAELERLKVYDQSVILLLSDHGEGLGDHGEEEHGILLYREALQVPLIVRLPGGHHAGTTAQAPAQIADVLPTLARLLGLEVPAGVGGVSLLSLLRSDAAWRPVVSETFYPRIHFGWSELLSATDGRRHYIEGPDPELYDLERDPQERRNLVAAERREAVPLRNALAAYPRALTAPASADAEARERLAALGYLTGSSAASQEGPRLDPKSQLPFLAALQSAFALYRAGDFAGAAAALRAIVEQNPRVLDAWEHLARSLERTGQLAEAAAAYERALELTAGDPDLAFSLSAVQIRLGEIERGLATARLAVRAGGGGAEMVVRVARQLLQAGRLAEAAEILRPAAEAGDVEALTALGLTLSEQGDQAGAAALLERALATRPTSAAAHEVMGLVALRRGDAAGAREHSRRAVVLEPDRARAWNNLGVALYMAGERAGAFSAWQRAVELDPTEYDALFNLGVKAAQAGRRVMAQRALRQFVDTAPPARYRADLDQARDLLRQLGG